MNIKALQILLVIAAVLCAIGVAALLAGKDASMPERFQPPGWISAMQGMASQPAVTRRELRRGGSVFPTELRLARGQAVEYSVVSDPDNRIRELEFQVLDGSVEITYETGDPEQRQKWPDKKYPDAKPNFVIYDTGGRLTFNHKAGNVRLRLKR